MPRKRIFLLLAVVAVFVVTIILISSDGNDLSSGNEKELALPRASSLFELGTVRNCRVTVDNVPVKAGAGNSFQTIAVLNKGDLVNVLGEIGDWYVIHLDNNQIGCLESIYAEPVVKTGYQNERPEPAEPGKTKEGEQPTRPVDRKPAPVEPDQNLSAMESEMLNLVNTERNKNSLPALKTDPELTRVARIKAQDMIDNNYFSHYSPTYGSPTEMMKSFDIDYLSAGENLAGNSSVEKAHQSLMNSSGHRKNILSPDFTHIGIGIKPSNRYGYIFVQMFINRQQ